LGREKVIHMIKTQSKNEEIREIREISIEGRDRVWYEVRREVWGKVLYEVRREVLHEVRRKLFK